MKWYAMIFVALLAATPELPRQVLAVDKIIATEGRFVFTDGASFFALDRDSTFRSGPLNLSGRVIEGRWREKSPGQFTVVGTWSWQNGLSAPNDRRLMTLILESPTVADMQRVYLLDPVSPVKVYRCYFTVDEIIKLPTPPTESGFPTATTLPAVRAPQQRQRRLIGDVEHNGLSFRISLEPGDSSLEIDIPERDSLYREREGSRPSVKLRVQLKSEAFIEGSAPPTPPWVGSGGWVDVTYRFMLHRRISVDDIRGVTIDIGDQRFTVYPWY